MSLHDLDFSSFRQTINPVGDDAIARGQPCGDHHFLAVLNTRFNQMFADFVVAVQHPDKVAFVAHLQGGCWDHNGILLRVDQHASVNKLIREQGIVLVVKAGLCFDGAGGGVNLVIEAQQHAFAQFL